MTAATAARAYALRWKDLPRWDIKTARASRFRLLHPAFRPMGDFVEEVTELVRPWERPEHEWAVYGVNNVSGVFFSHAQRGDTFNAPYKRVRPDWFFHNPTRANVGSLGRVPDVPEDSITSPEYQVWRVHDGLLPDYVAILIQCPFFIDLIECHRVGAVKERLFVENLREIPIPVRTLDEQRAIIAAWERAQREVVAARAEIASLEERIEIDFLAELGITDRPLVRLSKVLALPWSKIERWGVEFNRWEWSVNDLLASRFRMQPLEQVAWINPPLGQTPTLEDEVTFVPMESVDATSGTMEGAAVRPYREVRNGFTSFKEHDVIWAKITPCMQNGKCAIAAGLSNGVGCGSTEFHVVRSRDSSIVDVTYLWAILRLRRLREAAKRYFIGSAGQQRVPAEFLCALHVPVPPLAVQDELVSRITEHRRRIAALRTDVVRRADQAKAHVEAMILKSA